MDVIPVSQVFTELSWDEAQMINGGDSNWAGAFAVLSAIAIAAACVIMASNPVGWTATAVYVCLGIGAVSGGIAFSAFVAAAVNDNQP